MFTFDRFSKKGPRLICQKGLVGRSLSLPQHVSTSILDLVVCIRNEWKLRSSSERSSEKCCLPNNFARLWNSSFSASGNISEGRKGTCSRSTILLIKMSPTWQLSSFSFHFSLLFTMISFLSFFNCTIYSKFCFRSFKLRT